MAHQEATARPGRVRERDSGYTEGERAMPTAGENRMESIYRNPVGAQSDMPLEGQHEGGARAERPKPPRVRTQGKRRTMKVDENAA